MCRLCRRTKISNRNWKVTTSTCVYAVHRVNTTAAAAAAAAAADNDEYDVRFAASTRGQSAYGHLDHHAEAPGAPARHH